MIPTNEIKFADTVMLIDAIYVDRVVTALSAHFSKVLNRELPAADLSILLECMAMDTQVKPKNGVVQALFIYDKSLTSFTHLQPADLKKELNDVAFKSELGEFQLNTYEPQDMADRETFFLESLKLIVDAKEVKHLVVAPSEEEYASKLPEILKQVDGKEYMGVLGMNPPADKVPFEWGMLGYAVLRALGIRSEELN